MVFDFLGDKTKVVIAMAHIGALPGTPLYDADGGVDKLIEGVLRDIENLQAGGVDAIMFGNENDRPYLFKAPPEGVAAMTAVVAAVKAASQGPVRRQLSLGPARQRRHRRGDRRELRPRDLHRPLRLRHGALAARRRGRPASAPQSRPRRHEAPLQHQRRVRPFARRAPDRAAREERRLLLARRRDPGLRPADRRAGRPLEPRERPRGRPDVPVLANTGVTIDNVREILAIADGVRDRHPFQGRRQHLESGRWRRVKRFMDVVAKLR